MDNKIQYKIIFSDLDHTLLIENHIPDFNLEAIKKAREKGVKFVICTGRGFSIMKHLLEEIGTENAENEYTICNSGSLIYENKNQKILYSKELEFEVLKSLFEYGKTLDIVIAFDSCTGEHYIYNEEKMEKKWKSFKIKHKTVKNLDDLKDIKIARLIFTIIDKDNLKNALNN